MGILFFITEVVVVFGDQLNSVQQQSLEGGVAAEAGVSDALLFASPALGFLPVFVGSVALMLTAANSFAPYAAGGGHKLKLCLYAAILMIISGVSMMLVPALVQAVFTSVSAIPSAAGSPAPTN